MSDAHFVALGFASDPSFGLSCLFSTSLRTNELGCSSPGSPNLYEASAQTSKRTDQAGQCMHITFAFPSSEDSTALPQPDHRARKPRLRFHPCSLIIAVVAVQDTYYTPILLKLHHGGYTSRALGRTNHHAVLFHLRGRTLARSPSLQ